MMHKKYNPETIAPAYSNYVNGTEVDPGKRWLYVSGQCGVRKDGSIPDSFSEQCEVALDNVIEVLKSASMDVEDIVKVNFYMLNREHVIEAREVRDRKLKNIPVSSTLILVSGMILPEFQIEIECVAAK